MKSISVTSTIHIYEDTDDLFTQDQELIDEAEKAQKKAYAPYSKFKVGAAVLLKNGKVFTGNNQENASYPTGLCAERVAIFAASSQYPGVAIETVAITSSYDGNDPVAPCGSCRQVIYEYEHLYSHEIRTLLKDASGTVYKINSSKELLPYGFYADFLKR
jgi:cytidine deaminase